MAKSAGGTKEIALQDLIEDALNFFAGTLDNQVSWYLLVVKLDLEARGVIKIKIDNRNRRQLVAFKRAGSRLR